MILVKINKNIKNEKLFKRFINKIKHFKKIV